MNKASWIRALGLVCALGLIAVGCGGEGDSGGGADDQLAELKAQRSALQAKRVEVAQLKEQIEIADEAGEEAAGEEAAGEEAAGEEAAGEEATGEEGAEEAGAPAEDVGAQLEQAQDELDAMSEDFMGSLIMYLNSADMVQGEAPTGATLEAIRMKSAEDMLIAQEYITKGGDYRRAIEILETALILDPENPELQAARAQAEADRHMNEERFAAVTKGMTMDEVQDLLGTVHPNNLRNYPDKGIVAWFYRREDRGAAGVYFQEQDGEMKVYRADYNAVKADEEPEDEASGEG